MTNVCKCSLCSPHTHTQKHRAPWHGPVPVMRGRTLCKARPQASLGGGAAALGGSVCKRGAVSQSCRPRNTLCTPTTLRR